MYTASTCPIESTARYRLPSSLPMPNSKQDARMCSARDPSGFHQHPPGPADRSQTPDLAEIIANSLPLGGFSEEEARGRSKMIAHSWALGI